MARAIVTLPDPALRTSCAPVDRFDDGLARLERAMASVRDLTEGLDFAEAVEKRDALLAFA